MSSGDPPFGTRDWYTVLAMPLLTGFRATFRCLRDVEMDFTSPEDGKPSPFIAMVGANGAGKTTILEAVALLTLGIAGVGWHLTAREGQYITLQFEQGPIRFGPPDGLDIRGISDWGRFAPALLRTLYITSGYLPNMPAGKPLQGSPAAGMPMELALLPRDAASVQRRIDAVQQWWLHLHWEYPKTKTLDRLWEALRPFLGDLVYAGVNPHDHLPWFDDRGTRVSFNELSSGQRRLILLFLEIVMQCGEDGLVLFDEPEAHFHPIWQEMLPDALCQLVPHGQVIVATHAPHIVHGRPAHQVFVLGDLPWERASVVQ